ncbi:MAG: hypothetical protein R2784_02465 [Saprospiraceae bacterium]
MVSGQSGVGKSTLINNIAQNCLFAPTSYPATPGRTTHHPPLPKCLNCLLVETSSTLGIKTHHSTLRTHGRCPASASFSNGQKIANLVAPASA